MMSSRSLAHQPLSKLSWVSASRLGGEKAAARRETQLNARVDEIRVRLDPADFRIESVPLCLKQIELRDRPRAIALPRLLGGVERSLPPGARGTAACDAGGDGIPIAVDRVTGCERGPALASPGCFHRPIPRLDVTDPGHGERPRRRPRCSL